MRFQQSYSPFSNKYDDAVADLASISNADCFMECK